MSIDKEIQYTFVAMSFIGEMYLLTISQYSGIVLQSLARLTVLPIYSLGFLNISATASPAVVRLSVIRGFPSIGMSLLWCEKYTKEKVSSNYYIFVYRKRRRTRERVALNANARGKRVESIIIVRKKLKVSKKNR